MVASRWDAVVDAVISTLDSALSCDVYDCMPVTNDDIRSCVVVGAFTNDDRGLGGTITQGYHDVGPTATRDETGTIRATVLSQSGDDDVSVVRADAFSILGSVESALRANYSLGLSNILRVEVDYGDVTQGYSEHGVFCEIQLTISYTALI